MARKVCFVLLFIVSTAFLQAQEAVELTEQILSEMFEQYVGESESEIDFETFYNELMAVAANRINLNATNRHEMERLLFLSDQQIENVLYHIYRFGALHDIVELQLIDGLDMTDIRRMLYFVYVGESNAKAPPLLWRDVIKYGKNTVFLRADRSIEPKAGYKLTNDAEKDAKLYQGSPIYHSMRYRFQFKDRVQAGITAEKDAGESFDFKGKLGYDYLSAYLQLSKLGIFKTIVLGDYKASFGQGLAIRSDFSAGKSAYVLQVSARNAGLKKHSSTNEFDFFRGAGATINLNKFDISAFYSNKKIDGDTTGGSFSSFIQTGYHRTMSEISKKHTVEEQILGTNVTFTHKTLQLGANVLFSHFDNRLLPNKRAYNLFYFEGNQQISGSIYYKWFAHKFSIFGETAMLDNGAMATINGFNFSPISRANFVLLHRYYSPQYDALYARAFSESSRINNERGLYIGAEIRPIARWKLSMYADSYQHMWLKFGVDAPTVAQDYLLQIDHIISRQSQFIVRLRYEQKQSNYKLDTQPTHFVGNSDKASIRMQLTQNIGDFSFKTLVECNRVGEEGSAPTIGYMALQDANWRPAKLPLQLGFRYQFFDARAYGNRLYAYERDILYAFSIPMFYGVGSRYYFNAKYDIAEFCSLWFKIARTHYTDGRKEISSGNEAIAGNKKTDVRFLLRLKW